MVNWRNPRYRRKRTRSCNQYRWHRQPGIEGDKPGRKKVNGTRKLQKPGSFNKYHSEWLIIKATLGLFLLCYEPSKSPQVKKKYAQVKKKRARKKKIEGIYVSFRSEEYQVKTKKNLVIVPRILRTASVVFAYSDGVWHFFSQKKQQLSDWLSSLHCCCPTRVHHHLFR